MKLWDLLGRLAHREKFRILGHLMEQSTTPKQLARLTDLNPSTMRTLLRSLRKAGFVDYRTFGRFHVYHLASPLPGPVHELLLMMVRLEDIELSPQVSEEDADTVNWMDLWDARMQYIERSTWELLRAFLIPKSTRGRIQDYEQRQHLVRKLEDKIRHLKKELGESS